MSHTPIIPPNVKLLRHHATKRGQTRPARARPAGPPHAGGRDGAGGGASGGRPPPGDTEGVPASTHQRRPAEGARGPPHARGTH